MRLKSRNLEGDGHGVRKTFVSIHNPHFKNEIKDAQARNPDKNHKYFVLHVRLAGLCDGGGRIVVAPLAHKLVPPCARPPPESTKELRDAKILDSADPNYNLSVFSDGAFAWPNMCQAYPRLRNLQVNHRNNQFVKDVDSACGSSSVAGTQSIDQRWRRLDEYIPKEVQTKDSSHQVNDELYNYIWSWMWRQNMNNSADMFSKLGKLF